MAITAKDVAELRKLTGVGMMECKGALTEADGDIEKAIVILREKGLATQAKKAGRVSAEGLVCAAVNGNVGAIVEINSETDFVSKNEEFIAFANAVAQTVIDSNPADLDALKAAKISGGDKTVEESLQDLFMKIRENLQLRRFVRFEGTVVPYIHGGGKIGVLVKLDTDVDATAVGKDVAMQIAALNPAYLAVENVPQSFIDQERAIAKAQMAEDPKMAGKPEKVLENIVDGKIRKIFSETVLLEQEFVKDSEFNIKKYVEKSAKDLGGSITVTDFVRFELGEGIEKKSDDFAAEVASLVK